MLNREGAEPVLADLSHPLDSVVLWERGIHYSHSSKRAFTNLSNQQYAENLKPF
jgi:hypothetical protein